MRGRTILGLLLFRGRRARWDYEARVSEDLQFDQRLLQRVEDGVPLVREPYAELARQLNCGESTVLDRLRELRGDGGVVREVSAIFDLPRLGYAQSLVALAVDAGGLDAGGRIVADHPGVSHCYARDDEWDLWFTLAVSPASRLGLEGTVDRLAGRCGTRKRMILPTLRRYKLHVRLAASAAPPNEPPAPPRDEKRPPLELSDAQRRAVRALQLDLPNRSDPFAPLAKQANLPADELLVHAADLLAAGAMRRYAAVLRHHRAGYPANVLVVWKVGETAADAAGAICAQQPAVSHCYLRPASERWPYALYTMIHGRSRQDCEMTVEELLAKTGLREHRQLWTTREFKKQRVRLFDDEEATWEG